MCPEGNSKWSETLRSEPLDLFGFTMQGDGWGKRDIGVMPLVEKYDFIYLFMYYLFMPLLSFVVSYSFCI
jgi:hypothetical protein